MDSDQNNKSKVNYRKILKISVFVISVIAMIHVLIFLLLLAVFLVLYGVTELFYHSDSEEESNTTEVAVKN